MMMTTIRPAGGDADDADDADDDDDDGAGYGE